MEACGGRVTAVQRRERSRYLNSVVKGGEKAVQGRTGLVMAEQRKSKHRVQSGGRKGRWGQLIGGGERRQGKAKNDAAEQGLMTISDLCSSFLWQQWVDGLRLGVN